MREHTAKELDWNKITTCVIAVATVASVLISYFQWNVLDRQTKLALNDQRPWIIQVLMLNGPLVFDKENNAHINFLVKLKNVGHSPATNINLSIGARPAIKNNLFNQIPDEKTQCTEASNRAVKDSDIGHYLMPGEEKIHPIGTTVTHEQIMVPGVWVDNKHPTFNIVGCVDYTYSSSGEHGYTGFSYDLSKIIDKYGHTGGFMLEESIVPIDLLELIPDFFHGGLLK